MGQTAIFVDGGYFDRVSRDCGSPRIDFGKLATELAKPDDLLRTYYYHCLPYLSPVPTQEEEERLEGKKRFFSALNRLNRFEVREGKLEFRGTDRESNRPIFEQKRVDIYLGVDLVLLAVKQRVHRAILITGDSDFLPAIRAATEMISTLASVPPSIATVPSTETAALKEYSVVTGGHLRTRSGRGWAGTPAGGRRRRSCCGAPADRSEPAPRRPGAPPG